MKLVSLFALVVVAILSGCQTVKYGPLNDGVAPDYRSLLYVEAVGTAECDFEWIGFGEGQSIGTQTKSYDMLEAWKQATGGENNVVLLNANSQVVVDETTYGPLFFLNFRTETYKIWGQKVRIKSVTPAKGGKVQLKPETRTPAATEEKKGGLFSLLPF